mgnify:CR=1 FL=1
MWSVILFAGTLLGGVSCRMILVFGLRLEAARGDAPEGWNALAHPADLSPLLPSQYLLVEGGAQTAAAKTATQMA